MRWIQNLDLKNKLVLLASFSSAMALIMACSGFVWHDFQQLRSVQIDELKTKAEMLAISGASAMSHHQPEMLRDLILRVRAHATIDAACVYDVHGKVVASFPKSIQNTDVTPINIDHSTYRYSPSGELEFFHPMREQGIAIGVVYLRANMREFYEQVRNHATMILILTMCSLSTALLFGSMMQSLISKPILQLADAAQKIASNDDYAVRVTIDSRDELKTLYDSFNHMVQKIQSSHEELTLARDEMETRVQQRTSELLNEISQREQIQQELVSAKEIAETANKAKSRFLANMSHEIRTPLNSLLGFTDYVLMYDRDLLEEDRRDYLRTIKKSGDSLRNLINDILDLSKIEAEKMDFERIRFSPHNVIAEVVSVLRPQAYEKNLTLEYRWQGVVPDSIESDPARFRQLLMNLIGNAIKFTEIGGVEAVVCVDRSAQMLRVDVIDTGVGIPPETQQLLFNPFTQGDSSVTRRFGGTGLGLSICKSIVKGLGGEIHLKSAVGQGSTFSISIDCGNLNGVSFSTQPLTDILEDAIDSLPMLSLKSKRILVADDGETNRKLLQLLLRKNGAEVELVANGLEAVIAARNTDFDVILLDMQMPVMDGYSAAAQLRSEGFANPIVALTAHAMRGDEDRCLATGCSEYMTKPIRQEDLLLRMFALVSEQQIVTGDQLTPATFPQPPAIQFDPIDSELPISERPFAELVCEFILSARNKLHELRTAQAKNDTSQMSKLAHWMKGSGGMAGFPSITEYATKLETAVGHTDFMVIETRLTELETLIGQLKSPSLESTSEQVQITSLD